MTTRLTITPPAPFITANQRLHWRKRMELTKKWRTEAHELALDLVNQGVTHEHVHVLAHLRFADNRRRDVGNWYPTVKAVIDGAVEAGLLVDDSDQYVTGPDMRREYPNGSPRLTLEIREVA